MAGIDHTIITYKNGKLMKDTVKFTDDDQCISLLPFSYNRDGAILGYDFGRGFPLWGYKKSLKEKIAALFSDEGDPPVFFSYVDKNVEIILCEHGDFNVTFYFDAKNSYVMIGGYGHYANPYIHFYHRGYGEDFERKMAQECYDWLCEDILKEAVESIQQYAIESEHHLSRLQTRLGYKDFWQMTPEEQDGWENRRMDYYMPTKADESPDDDPLLQITL